MAKETRDGIPVVSFLSFEFEPTQSRYQNTEKDPLAIGEELRWGQMICPEFAISNQVVFRSPGSFQKPVELQYARASSQMRSPSFGYKLNVIQCG